MWKNTSPLPSKKTWLQEAKKTTTQPSKTTTIVESIKIERSEEGKSKKPALRADQYNQWNDRTMAYPMKSSTTGPVVETINIDRSEGGKDKKPVLKADQYNQWNDRTMAYPMKAAPRQQAPPLPTHKPAEDNSESEHQL